MQSNPNQKIITVDKELSNKNNLYATFNLKALKRAMTDLKGETFKLWCYINKNQNGYKFALSKVDALENGIGSKSSYDRAVTELIDKGYLIRQSGNSYIFYEMPEEQQIEIIIKKCDV